jgi:predicted membrane protein
MIARPNRIACEELKLEVGAASFEANGLSNLNCAKLNVQGGVGEVILDFSGKATRDMKADIQMGLGSLTLRVPRGVGLQVTKEGLLATFDSQGLVKRGNTYFSEDWKSAAQHITLNISAAFGSIDVKWSD